MHWWYLQMQAVLPLLQLDPWPYFQQSQQL
jgi:hypothetical protein